MELFVWRKSSGSLWNFIMGLMERNIYGSYTRREPRYMLNSYNRLYDWLYNGLYERIVQTLYQQIRQQVCDSTRRRDEFTFGELTSRRVGMLLQCSRVLIAARVSERFVFPVASSQELWARRGIVCRGFHLPPESRRRALHRGNFAGQEESLTQQLVKQSSYVEECDVNKYVFAMIVGKLHV